MRIRFLSTSIQLGPKLSVREVFDVLLDESGKPYILPIFPQTKFEDGIHYDSRLYFEPSETVPDPQGGEEYRIHQKGLSMKDCIPAKI